MDLQATPAPLLTTALSIGHSRAGEGGQRHIVSLATPAGADPRLGQRVVLLEVHCHREAIAALGVEALVLLAQLEQAHGSCSHDGAHYLHERALIDARVDIVRPKMEIIKSHEWFLHAAATYYLMSPMVGLESSGMGGRLSIRTNM